MFGFIFPLSQSTSIPSFQMKSPAPPEASGQLHHESVSHSWRQTWAAFTIWAHHNVKNVFNVEMFIFLQRAFILICKVYNILLKNVYIDNKPKNMELNASLMKAINNFHIEGVIFWIMLLMVHKYLEAWCRNRKQLKSSQEPEMVWNIPVQTEPINKNCHSVASLNKDPAVIKSWLQQLFTPTYSHTAALWGCRCGSSWSKSL